MKGVDYCTSKLSVFLANLLIYQQYVNTAPCVQFYTVKLCKKKVLLPAHVSMP